MHVRGIFPYYFRTPLTAATHPKVFEKKAIYMHLHLHSRGGALLLMAFTHVRRLGLYVLNARVMFVLMDVARVFFARDYVTEGG